LLFLRRIFLWITNMIEFRKLSSGISLVTDRDMDMQSACIGVMAGAGSCTEDKDIEGISHVIEHMFFKGTKKRNFTQIAEDADNLGASYNAFTGKEATCFHIKTLTDVFPEACEILFDMLLNSLFDPGELKRELGVIREEMHMVLDTPDDYINDLLTEAVFKGTELESQIIGTKKTLAGMSHDKIVKYIGKYYSKDNIVISVVGNFDENILEKQINEYFSGLNEKSPEIERKQPSGTPVYINRSKDINQSHIALGIPALSLASDDYYAEAIVNDVLGGSMSSRLFQNIREHKGLAYTVFSYPMAYSNSGALCIYAGLSLGNEKDAVDAIAAELHKLGEEGLTKEHIENIKTRLKSSYIFGREKLENRMIAMAKNRLLLGRNYTPEETLAEIDAVTQDQVNSFCKRISDIGNYSGATISKERLNIKKMIG